MNPDFTEEPLGKPTTMDDFFVVVSPDGRLETGSYSSVSPKLYKLKDAKAVASRNSKQSSHYGARVPHRVIPVSPRSRKANLMITDVLGLHLHDAGEINGAAMFAIAAHTAKGQRRKYTGEPYWHHCRRSRRSSWIFAALFPWCRPHGCTMWSRTLASGL